MTPNDQGRRERLAHELEWMRRELAEQDERLAEVVAGHDVDLDEVASIEAMVAEQLRLRTVRSSAPVSLRGLVLRA